MPSERVQRQIDLLLDQAEAAIANQDWKTVGDRARSALRLDPENQDVLAYLAAAERDLHLDSSLPAADISPRTIPQVDEPALEADKSRARLEQYIPKELLAKLEGTRNDVASSERRVVTMLFCDVTGSTAAAESLDPEEWAEIMNGAFEYLISPIYRYEGTLARLMGDAILAFFGPPIAHEDDPQRAVLAGLHIVQGIRAYQEEVKSKWNLDFGVRVGINTGLVVVGEVGSDMRVEYTAMGDAINLAARMEQTAQTGTVQVAADTYNLIAPIFDFESLGGIEVKGKSEPVPAYRVIGPKAVPGRLRGIEGLSARLVGRDNEISAMTQAFENLHLGVGGIVCLIGEAGIGKTSLLEDAKAKWRRIAGSEAPWVEGHGVSYETARPFGLFLQLARQIYGIEETDPLALMRDKVAKTQEAFPPQVQNIVIRVIEALFAVGTDSDAPHLQGEALQQELYQANRAIFHASASHRPTVIVLDDLHWADPASVEMLIDSNLSLVDEVPILLIFSFRPERQSPAWRIKQTAETEYPHRYTEISLTALSDGESDLLFGNLLSVSDSPPQLRQMILAKTGGNPLILEELMRSLIDSGAITQDQTGMHWKPGTRIEELPIPENLLALITARIDQLGDSARRTLQLSSVIGRSFHHGVLNLISDAAITLDRQLNTLQRAELIREAARVPELEYIFRHDLTRDAAYNSILLRERREFHGRVGQAIEEIFSGRLEEQSHLLAYHFNQAGDTRRALEYSVMAGDAAARLFANDEATTHFSRAIELARQGDTPNQQLIELYMARGRTQEIGGLFDDALSGYQELEELGRVGLDAALELAALLAMVTIYSTINAKPDPERARVLLERSLSLAGHINDHPSQARILWQRMLLENLAGEDFFKALEFGEHSLKMARMYDLGDQIAYTLQDMARSHLAVGQFVEAKEALEGARISWRNFGDQPMLADNLINSAGVIFAEGANAAGYEMIEEALDISHSIGSVHLEAAALAMVSQAHLETGDVGLALAAVEDGIAKSDAATGAMSALLHGTASAIYGLCGMADHALDEALISIDLATPGQLWYFTISLALAYLESGRLSEAEEALQISYEDPQMESKRNIEYLGMISALPDVLRGELALAKQQCELVLAYDLEDSERAANSGRSVLFPDLLRIKGQALLALGRVREAGEVLTTARDMALVQGSKRALWPILFELGQVAVLEDSALERGELIQQSRDTVNYIADRCGSSEIRDAFLNAPKVRKVLGA
ncbi:MAG: hypothetical protein BZY75_02365 [SAR202 cluster bacterium Io17-Chloro-G7]|nr:MAG: hypothetical protein BZY75_02365 [SAR202 cluster bacterium Io17-Chloro-G7]